MPFINLSERALQPYWAEYKSLEIEWQNRLLHFCPHLEATDWEKFRPLRRSREEDWSDWLAWLLETSSTGVLAGMLFDAESKRDCKRFRLGT